MSRYENVTTIDHPLVQHKLTIMRNKETSTSKFRTVCHEIAMLLAYEISRDLPLTHETIETPLTKFDAPVIEGKKIVFVSILRAGNALLEGMLQLIPSARVGHIGLYRDPKSLAAIEYYFKLPDDVSDRHMVVLDPMLATGHSAIAAVSRLKEVNPRSIRFVSLLCSPEGIQAFHGEHPEVPIVTCAIDQKLNEKGYIVPGLGDAGDRFYGTK
jgi:uracil phosphoribosyltransferase